MFEYIITGETLNNIAGIEYSKAIIDSLVIMPIRHKSLVNDAKANTLYYSLQLQGINTRIEDVKKIVNRIQTKRPGVVNQFNKALDKLNELSSNKEFEETEIKELYRCFEKTLKYRSKRIPGNLEPQEILAQVIRFIDWYNSLDAKQTHPIILATLVNAQFLSLQPFENNNDVMALLITQLSLKITNYSINDYVSLSEFFFKTQKERQRILQEAYENADYTLWIEYFTDGFNREASKISEMIKVMAKNAKIEKSSQGMRLSERQERIVMYLQDYGMIQNKDFEKLFPDISEDTVLRDLKYLTDNGIIVKLGKTKSSRYELL